MDYRKALPPSGPIRQAALCVLLMAFAVGLVFGTTALMERREPYVDLSQRARVVSARTSSQGGKRLRFAVATIVSPEPTFAIYRRLVRRIARDVGCEDVFVMRPSYQSVRGALEKGEVDVALVCTGPYVHALPGKRVELLVQPEFVEGVTYRSEVIVPADSEAKTVDDLKGQVVAFTDPESHTGREVLCAMLFERGLRPDAFFSKVIFTGNHDRSIEAVAHGIVDAAAVHGCVLELAKREDEALAERVRTVWASETFGSPPIVVPVSVDPELRRAMQEAFLALDKDEEGRAILAPLGIRRFVAPRLEDYASAVALVERLHAWEAVP